MMAFNETHRRHYFNSTMQSKARLGPKHVPEEFHQRGANGAEGVKWFENMLTCFSLPTRPRGAGQDGDAFEEPRHMCEICMIHFVNCDFGLALDFG